MPSPVTPSDIKAQLVTASGATCDKLLRALFTFPTKFYQWFSYVYKEDGTFTDEFKADLCAIDCTTLGGGGGSGLLAPSLTITLGATPHVAWNTVAGAAWYELARSTDNLLSEATLISTSTINFFDDGGTSASTWYYYWVRGVNATTQGDWSAAELGAQSNYAVTAAGSPVASTGNSNYVEFTWDAVPEATSYQVVRNTSNTTAGATVLGTTTVPWFHDFNGVLSTAYYYFVRSYNPHNSGSYSASALGSRP